MLSPSPDTGDDEAALSLCVSALEMESLASLAIYGRVEGRVEDSGIAIGLYAFGEYGPWLARVGDVGGESLYRLECMLVRRGMLTDRECEFSRSRGDSGSSSPEEIEGWADDLVRRW